MQKILTKEKGDRIIPRFLTQALRGVPLTVQGDGLQERTMCYVGDVVRALEIVMEQGVVRGIYNIGSDEKITMIEFAQKVLSLTQSQSEISHTERPAHDHFSRMPDLHKIYSLGWKRTVPLDQGLDEMIQEYKGLLSL